MSEKKDECSREPSPENMATFFFRWHTSAFFFQNNPLDHIFYLTPRKRALSALKYFFWECVHFQQLHFPYFARQLGYFWSILVKPQAKAKTCKCVYLKRVFIQIYFWILFTGSEELIVSHTYTYISSEAVQKKNENMGPEFSCCDFFFFAIRILMWFSTLLIFHHHNAAATSRHQSVTSFTELL